MKKDKLTFSIPDHKSRSYKFFGTLLVELVLIFGIYCSDYFDLIICFIRENKFQNLVSLLLSAPSALWIWKWRDANKLTDQIQIETSQNSAENLANFNKFLEFQDRVVDQKDPNDKKAIGAVHHLEPFLLGDYGQELSKNSLITFRSFLNEQYNKERTKYQNLKGN
ncbi:MAG: hypothetical protein QNL04_08565, partial [SAR324 cluster bacterium]|nr:hypothetical protein [SAR324 cluster bacterium]